MHRARQDHLSLDTRARICGYSLCKALWGTESYVVGGPWLKELRSTIAKTLVLNKGNSNPYIACALLTPHVVDPTSYLIRNSVRNLRSWMQRATPTVFQAFMWIARRSSVSHHEFWGPASALAYNLSRIGWSITKEALILTDDNLEFPICTLPKRTFSHTCPFHG